MRIGKMKKFVQIAALALAGLVLWAQAALLVGKKPRDLMR